MDLLEDIAGAIDSVFDTILPPEPCNKRARGDSCFVVVASDAPEGVLPEGLVLRTRTELRKVLQAAARHLRDEAKGHMFGGRRHYTTDLRRVSDGAEHRVYVNRDDAKRTNWFRGADW